VAASLRSSNSCWALVPLSQAGQRTERTLDSQLQAASNGVYRSAFRSSLRVSPASLTRWGAHADFSIPGFLAALILLFPESPRWLIDHGKTEEGLKTLARLHAHGDTSDPWVRAEFDQIQDMITYEHENEAKSYVELFTNKSSFRRLFLAVSMQASVQMTGVSAIQYYRSASDVLSIVGRLLTFFCPVPPSSLRSALPPTTR
jgi:hypothetical protein